MSLHYSIGVLQCRTTSDTVRPTQANAIFGKPMTAKVRCLAILHSIDVHHWTTAHVQALKASTSRRASVVVVRAADDKVVVIGLAADSGTPPSERHMLQHIRNRLRQVHLYAPPHLAVWRQPQAPCRCGHRAVVIAHTTIHPQAATPTPTP